MSIRLMTAVWLLQIRSTAKLVLLALCDNANEDSGKCFLLVKTLMKKCSLSERAIQIALTELEQLGYIERQERRGRSTIFVICTPRIICTPAADAPPQEQHPAESAPTPAAGAPTPAESAPTPAAGAPITVSYPSSPLPFRKPSEEPPYESERWMRVKDRYPEFAGKQDWINAQKFATQLVTNGEATWDVLYAGVDRYARFCEHTGILRTTYVMRPGKFFSDIERPWLQDWKLPEQQKPQQQKQLTAVERITWRPPGLDPPEPKP